MHCVPPLRGICIAVPVAFPDGFCEPPAVSSAVPRALATASMHSVSQNGSAPAISIQVLSASIMMHCTLLRQFRIAFLHCCCRVFGRSVLNVALHDALLSVRHRLFLTVVLQCCAGSAAAVFQMKASLCTADCSVASMSNCSPALLLQGWKTLCIQCSGDSVLLLRRQRAAWQWQLCIQWLAEASVAGPDICLLQGATGRARRLSNEDSEASSFVRGTVLATAAVHAVFLLPRCKMPCQEPPCRTAGGSSCCLQHFPGNSCSALDVILAEVLHCP